MESYIGEIRMFAGNFAPINWNFCDGSLLSIAEYEALYMLIGTTYGGDGITTFGLPDLRGRIPVHQEGVPPGSSFPYSMGQMSGSESVTLTNLNLPAHNHTLKVSGAPATATIPSSDLVPGATSTSIYYTDQVAPAADMRSSLTPSGSSQPISIMMPSVAISFIISLYGIFPSQQ